MQKARRHLQQKAPTACRRTVSGSISTSCSECFSPFPHGTGSLSVSREYSALPDGPGRFRRDCTCPALLRIPLQSGKAARKGLSPAAAARSSAFRSPSRTDVAVLQPRRRRNACGLGFSPFARRYWGNHCCFLFLRVLRCFSSPRWPPAKAGCHPFRMTGCPIRKSADQRRLFAACRVLRRLREPRHPPCALNYFPAPPHLRGGISPGLASGARFRVCHIMSSNSFLCGE